MTLTEFLVLAITADETEAAAHAEWKRIAGSEDWWSHQRVLAECAAHLRIVELHAIDCWVGTGPCGGGVSTSAPGAWVPGTESYPGWGGTSDVGGVGDGVRGPPGYR
jgi:hypothetical protein